jgi:NAD(P)-dependent dehydrogenase (short-subunit alcohol dehydrogenase family)
MEKITEEHFDKTFSINVKGVFFTVQKALPLFKEGGSIILNASTAGSKASKISSVYGATKAAVRSFARSFTAELKNRKIRVNALSPGPIDTPGLSDAFSSLGMTDDQMKKTLISFVPLGRLGTPDEVAKVVLFLASDDSSFITGIELFVDGGMAQI